MAQELTVSFAEVAREAMRRVMLELGVCRPASVISYDSETLTVQVQPLHKRVVRAEGGELVEVTPPPLACRVWTFDAGGFVVVPSILPGDVVGLIVPDRTLGPLEAADRATTEKPLQPVEPGLSRAHDVSDAVAVPGLIPTDVGAAPPPGTDAAPLLLRHKAGLLEIAVYPDGRIRFGLEGTAEADQRGVRGDVLATFLESLGNWLTSHTHPAPGGATSPPAGPPPSAPADLLSDLFRLK